MTYSKLTEVELQLDDFVNKRIQFMIERLRLEKFEYNNKSGKYLANQLKCNKEKTLISVVMDLAGKPMLMSEDINDTFRSFYSNLQRYLTIQ